MAFARYLRERQEMSVALQAAHREIVRDLQDGLKATADELGLDQTREWIDDEKSIFRMLKKHNFGAGEAQVALEETLRWRTSASVLAHLRVGTGTAFVRCLPSDMEDVDGRPIMLVKLAGLPRSPEQTKAEILGAYETMRVRLHSSNNTPGATEALQCIIMVDFAGANLRSMPVEVIPWFVREIAPHFPGMCSAVLVVNYSWPYVGAYNLVKRVLPATVLERIRFPTRTELFTHFEKGRLLRDYGGELDLSAMGRRLQKEEGDDVAVAAVPSPSDILTHYYRVPVPVSQETRLPSSSYLSSMSALNPFYGYPVVTTPHSTVAKLKNGRRRKRDLARTLTLLWLAKLKRMADKTWLWIVMTLVVWVAGFRARAR